MDRRRFVKASIGGAALFSFSGLTLLSTQKSAQAAPASVDLIAESVVKQLVDGAAVPMWQFRDPVGTGPGAMAAGLVVQQGDEVTINLTNNLDRNINFSVPDLFTNGVAVAPGASQSYVFGANTAGSFLMVDGINGLLSQAMGLAAPLVVMPSDGSRSLTPGGPLFDRQYTLFLQEVDSRLNDAINAGLPYELANYEPNYFFANGLSYPDTANDSDTFINMLLNQNIALRFINGSLIYNAMHFHGYHVDVMSRNRVPETQVVHKDTVLVRVGECVDVMLNVNQIGRYPLHNHYLPGVTANGVYANGALLMMNAV